MIQSNRVAAFENVGINSMMQMSRVVVRIKSAHKDCLSNEIAY